MNLCLLRISLKIYTSGDRVLHKHMCSPIYDIDMIRKVTYLLQGSRCLVIGCGEYHLTGMENARLLATHAILYIGSAHLFSEDQAFRISHVTFRCENVLHSCTLRPLRLPPVHKTS